MLFVDSVLVIISLILVYILYEVGVLRRITQEALDEEQVLSVANVLAPDVEEIPEHIVERNQSFDERISQMQTELLALQHGKPQIPDLPKAQILHPGIYNLPDNTIPTAQGEAPGEFEVAE